MKTNPLNYCTPALLFAAGFTLCFDELRAQETSAVPEAPAVSTEALDSVAAPGVKKASSGSPAGGGSVGNTEEASFPGQTDLDTPGAVDPRFLAPVGVDGKATVSRLSKIDIDADLNYDGTFDNDSSDEQGQWESVPPGLELGVGELSRILVRFKTYEVDFPGKLVVTLEVNEVNRDSTSGESAGSTGAAAGRVRVWRDSARKELLVDSADPSKRRYDWTFDKEKRSGGIPRTLYVEGVTVSPKFEGDLRLLVSSSHVADGDAEGTPSSLYRAALDHLIVTVREKPVEKEFINNNVEGVWSMIGKAEALGSETATNAAVGDAQGTEAKPR